MAGDGVGKERNPVFPAHPDCCREAVPLSKTQVDRDEHGNQCKDGIENQCGCCPKHRDPGFLVFSYCCCLYRCTHGKSPIGASSAAYSVAPRRTEKRNSFSLHLRLHSRESLLCPPFHCFLCGQ